MVSIITCPMWFHLWWSCHWTYAYVCVCTHTRTHTHPHPKLWQREVIWSQWLDLPSLRPEAPRVLPSSAQLLYKALFQRKIPKHPCMRYKEKNTDLCLIEGKEQVWSSRKYPPGSVDQVISCRNRVWICLKHLSRLDELWGWVLHPENIQLA